MAVTNKALPSTIHFKIVKLRFFGRDKGGYVLLMRGSRTVTYHEDQIFYDPQEEVFWVSTGKQETKTKGGVRFEVIYTWLEE